MLNNSERPTDNTYRIIAVVSTKVRKDSNEFVVEKDFLQNEERVKYSKEFMTTEKGLQEHHSTMLLDR